MPVRSLSSSVLAWPDARAVDHAVRRWVRETLPLTPEVVRVGYFGSSARGDCGVGSDLDLLIIVERSEEAFERRPVHWDLTTLPVPADVLVYTAQEWESLPARSPFGIRLASETVWVYQRNP